MARVPLVEEQDHPELAELFRKLKGGRGGRLLNIYTLLLNSPTLANTWFDHVSAVRWQTQLDGQTRELSVLIGTYNMHTRVLQALEIDLEPSRAAS